MSLWATSFRVIKWTTDAPDTNVTKEKPYTRDAVEIGEKIRHKLNKKQQSRDVKFEVNLRGPCMETSRRTGEAIVGTEAGAVGAGTNRRMGAHRR